MVKAHHAEQPADLTTCLVYLSTQEHANFSAGGTIVAPVVTPTTIVIVPWPLFQSFVDGVPNIGGTLYGYVPGTSTPKATFSDPWLVVPNPWPVTMNDQGAATVHLSGLYDLRLFDAEDTLLWQVDSYQFATGAPPPAPGEKIVGSTSTTVNAANGQGVISVPGLVPAGYRCEGVTFTLTANWGSSQGLTGIFIGDGIANDRFAHITTLTAGTTGGQVNFHSDVTPVEPIPYTILLAANGGLFDSNGSIHITAYWSTLPADVP